MVTEKEYLEAKKVVEEWLKLQPQDSKYPYKPPTMSVNEYSKQRALNEVLRYLFKKGWITYDEFGKILDRFDLSIFSACNNKNELVLFTNWNIEIDVFTNEKIPNDYNQISHLANKLKDNDPDN